MDRGRRISQAANAATGMATATTIAANFLRFSFRRGASATGGDDSTRLSSVSRP